MADGFVQVPPDSTGKKVDAEELSVNGQTVERQRAQIAGRAAADIAEVKNATPAINDYGLATRVIPGSSNVTSAAYNATDTSTTALAANAARRGLLIQNVSDTWVFGRFGAAPVATPGSEEGFLIPPGGGAVTFYAHVDTRALNVIHASAGNNKRLLITEW